MRCFTTLQILCQLFEGKVYEPVCICVLVTKFYSFHNNNMAQHWFCLIASLMYVCYLIIQNERICSWCRVQMVYLVFLCLACFTHNCIIRFFSSLSILTAVVIWVLQSAWFDCLIFFSILSIFSVLSASSLQLDCGRFYTVLRTDVLPLKAYNCIANL